MRISSYIALGRTGRRSAVAALTLGLVVGASAPAGAVSFTTLYNFGQNGGGADAASPQTGSLLYDSKTGKFYDGTWAGGTSGLGTVFSINPNGSGEKVLHSFAGKPNDGAGGGGLILVGTMLYGTTYQGGTGPCGDRGAGGGCGTVYSIKLNGTHEKVLYSLQNTFDGFDGEVPVLYDKSTSKLYGVTDDGGQFGGGTVFSLNTDGSDPTVLYALGEDGDALTSDASVIRVKDKLYGTASTGGACNAGAVFWTNVKGTAHNVIYSFCGGNDGNGPTGPLTYVKETGLLYGTTQNGGGACNCGTVFSVDPKTGKEKVIYPFQGHPDDGSLPTYTGVTYFDGKLYGVTSNGGNGTCASGACGTVFSMNPDGSNEQVIHSFQGTDGWRPEQDLIVVNNTLYGTTFFGGTFGSGVIYSITP